MANPHPKIENLKPCKPGEVRNPAGRPKGTRDFKTVLREALEALDTGKQKHWGNPVVLHLIKILECPDAKDSDKLRAIQDIVDRMEGKPQQTIDAKVEHSASEQLLNFMREINGK